MNKSKAWVGIDPGKTGAIALIAEREVIVHDFDGVSEMSELLVTWKFEYDIVRVLLENVSAMKGWGIKGCFSFGKNVGNWEGIVATLKFPYDYVTPKKWQSTIFKGTKVENTKKESIETARRLFPLVTIPKSKDGRSDALLIAEYNKRIYG
jgi:hypothetical protein